MFDKIRNFFGAEKVVKVTSYTCTCCGKQKHDWPAISYGEPDYYGNLSDEQRQDIAELKSDTCIIAYEDETNYFIRCVLFQDIIDSDEQLHYGLWVSLSQKNFNDYIAHFDEDDREGGYFGWISNNLLGYDNTTTIPSDVYLGKNGQRLEIVPHSGFDHPFVKDYYNGITIEEAHKRIAVALKNS